MEIRRIDGDKKRFLDLLLLADEQESMIDRYLERGTLFALYDDGLKSVCVVTDEGDGCFEIKNLATVEHSQRRGYGRHLVNYVFDHCRGRCKTLLVGTGDSPSILPFYEKCGFKISHRVPNFFVDNYDHPIIDNGVQLVDMVYLKKDFERKETE